MLTDSALLERYARMGDADAFAELVRRYGSLVYSACLRITGNRQDAEDAAQECFLELARKSGTITKSLPGWLHRVAKNRAIDVVRKDSTRRCYEREVVPDPGLPEATWADIAPIVDEALERLPEHLRLPLILHYFQGMNQTQVARTLGLNQSTVSRNLEKAITTLREDLRKSGVLVSVVALGVILTENTATAMPETLTVALGKMAVSGVGAGSAGVGVLTAISFSLGGLMSTFVGKAVIVSVIVTATLGTSYGIYANRHTDTSSISTVESKSAPEIQTIITALEKQESASGPSLDITYTMEALQPSAGSGCFKTRYVRTPKVLYQVSERGRYDSTNTWKLDETVTAVYNRSTKEFRELGTDDSGKIIGARLSTNGGPNRFTSDDVPDVILKSVLGLTPLIDFVRTGTVARQQELVDGVMCWRIDGPIAAMDSNKGSCVSVSVWLDPKVSFCPRQIVEKWEGDGVASSATTRAFKDYKLFGKGVWLPKSQIVYFNDTRTQGTKIELTTVSVGKKIPDTELSVSFPTGTKVYKLPEGTYTTTP